MQAATTLSFSVIIPIKGTKSMTPRSVVKFNSKSVSTRAVAVTAEPSVVSYESPIS
jgi:hypothetical protein